MDTKLKKCKAVIGTAAFFLGISLLIQSLVTGMNSSGGRSWSEQRKEMSQEDYQNTERFREYISETLEDFLAMAAGGPISGYWNYEYDSSDYYGNSGYTGTATVVENAVEGSLQSEAVIESIEDYGYDNFHRGYSYDSTEIDTPYNEKGSAEENKKMAERLHEILKNDKNLLYTIRYDGKELFSNTDGAGLEGLYSSLPKEYNFRLYFDGSTVKILKDGKELDIYGTGYYKEDSEWYVPGYKNFAIDDESKKAEICIAVAKSPMLYINANYSGYNKTSMYQNNTLYWIEKEMREIQDSYRNARILLAVGAACILLFFIFRRNKKQGDMLIAKVTGKIWFEVKVIILLFTTGYLLYLTAPAGLREFLYEFRNVDMPFHYAVYRLGGTISNVVPVLLLFWSWYFVLNDWHYNKKPWKHSVTYHVIRLFETSGLKLTFQKRMIYQFIPVFVLNLIIAVIGIALYFSAAALTENLRYYSQSDKNFTDSLWMLAAAVIVISLVVQVIYIKRNKTMLGDIGTLMGQIKAVREGNLTEKMDLPEDVNLSEAVQDLGDIQQGMNMALEEQMKSERMKVELVSNVSHDIKTPLTSIISYVELLNQEEDLPEHIRDYVKILENKSERLKSMVQDVFEVSKAASGQLPVALELLDFGKLLRQTLADMEERIKSSNVVIKTEIPEEPVMIMSDGKRLYRVFQNLLQNALQYSLQGSRVFVTLKTDGIMAAASVKNTSETEIPDKIDFTERFTRGDGSRSDGGSGLGLSIAKSFTEACGGEFQLEIIADLFVVTIGFEEKIVKIAEEVQDTES